MNKIYTVSGCVCVSGLDMAEGVAKRSLVCKGAVSTASLKVSNKITVAVGVTEEGRIFKHKIKDSGYMFDENNNIRRS